MASGRELRGMGVSAGIAIGPAFVLRRDATAGQATLRPEEVPAELERLRAALQTARRQLEDTRDRSLQDVGDAAAAIFQAQLLMLADPELVGRAERLVKEELVGPEQAIKRAGEEIAACLDSIADEYLRGRAGDVRDIAGRVCRALAGRIPHPLASLPSPVVVAGDELMPSDTAEMDRERVLGFVMEKGGPNAHAAILARTMGIPAVAGVAGIRTVVTTGTTLVADGRSGLVLIEPSPEALAAWKQRQAAERRRRERLPRGGTRVPVLTRDGRRVKVAANIGALADLASALAHQAEAIGLFRTEFLFAGRQSPPCEDEQFEAYRQVAQAMAGRPVIIRTLDVGGDKPVPWLPRAPEANPFLGVRGLRLSLRQPEIFLTQLRAVLRARRYGDVRVMFPMVADVSEEQAARDLLGRAREELEACGWGRVDLPVGIMIEIPSAAILADHLLEQVDFVSIGTNDLTQYTLAVDRTHAELAGSADALHPAVLRLLAGVVEAGRARNRWVGVCGDLAGEPRATAVLVGLGVNELSMAPSLIPEVIEAIRALTISEARELARAAVACRTALEVGELLRRGHR